MVAHTRRISPGSGMTQPPLCAALSEMRARPERPAWSEPSPQARNSHQGSPVPSLRMADDLARWPGAERRDPPRTSPTWVVRHALAEWLRGQAADLVGRGPVRVLDVGCGPKPYYPFFAAIS